MIDPKESTYPRCASCRWPVPPTVSLHPRAGGSICTACAMRPAGGRIIIQGPYPPPTGVVGPFARRTESYVYGVYGTDGRKLVGGTGSAKEATLSHAQAVATKKGLNNPVIEYLPA